MWRAFITLIRFPNLIFIYLAQWITYQFIVIPACIPSHILSVVQLHSILLSTSCIAAAGYMINDYFDLGIDAINKPEKITIEKYFSRRKIIIWHIALNLIGLAIGAYIAYHVVLLRFIAIQLISIFLLLVYSTTLKRKLFIGNITIGVLNGLSIYMMAIYEPAFSFNISEKHTRLIVLYTGFACIITWIREIVKDIEDVKGDAAQFCHTIPLVYGIQTAKNIVYALSIFLIAMVAISFSASVFTHLQFTLLCVCVCVPLMITNFILSRSKHTKQFHQISSAIKWITLAGIITIAFSNTFI